MGLRQVEQGFSSFFAKFLAYLYLMIFQSTVKLTEEFAFNSFSADFWNPKIQFQVPDPTLVVHRLAAEHAQKRITRRVDIGGGRR